MADAKNWCFAPKVMVIDDNSDFCRSMTSFLSSVGFLTTFSDKPLSAEIMAAKQHPDIVLLDLHMPNINSIELGMAIKKRRPWAQLVYMVTAADTELVEKALATGGEAILFKPFRNMQVVYQTVRQCAQGIDAWQQSMLTNLQSSFPGEYEIIFGNACDGPLADDPLDMLLGSSTDI